MEQELISTIKTLSVLLKRKIGSLNERRYNDDALATMDNWTDFSSLRQLHWYIAAIVEDDIKLGYKYNAEIADIHHELFDVLQYNKYE